MADPAIEAAIASASVKAILQAILRADMFSSNVWMSPMYYQDRETNAEKRAKLQAELDGLKDKTDADMNRHLINQDIYILSAAIFNLENDIKIVTNQLASLALLDHIKRSPEHHKTVTMLEATRETVGDRLTEVMAKRDQLIDFLKQETIDLKTKEIKEEMALYPEDNTPPESPDQEALSESPAP